MQARNGAHIKKEKRIYTEKKDRNYVDMTKQEKSSKNIKIEAKKDTERQVNALLTYQ